MSGSGRYIRYLVALALAWPLAGMASWASLPAHSRSQPTSSSLSQPAGPAKAQVSEAFGKLPLYFVENRGQMDGRVAYYLQGSDKTIYFTAEGLTFTLNGQRDRDHDTEITSARAALRPAASSREITSESAPPRYALKLDFVGTNPGVRPRGQEQTEAVFSYFKGSRDQWQTGLKTYARLVYPELWPGIDLVYAGTVNRMKYSFVVKPGADPRQIKLAYRGASEVKINQAGELEVKTPVNSFRDERPVSYQDVDGQRIEVATAYELEAGTQVYGFEVGEYDRRRELVIDPVVLVYCGYIGGGRNDEGNGIAVDSLGNIYVTGMTASDEMSFPETFGPDTGFNGFNDAFVAKVNAAGTELIYCGYIGGSQGEGGLGIAVDSANNAYITGFTGSSEDEGFPVTEGPDLSINGMFGADAFVAKVDAEGTQLIYCGYIGGDAFDEGHSIAVDSTGHAYVTGLTNSKQPSFPVTVGADVTFNGFGGGTLEPPIGDAFVAKVNAKGDGLDYCGYIGGRNADQGWGIAVDSEGNAYVIGETSSAESSSDESSFPVRLGPDTSFNGFDDAFVAKVNASGTALVYCGYIGGREFDAGLGIAVDSDGNAYVTGVTRSPESSFPERVGPDRTYNEGSDVFVAKVHPTGTLLLYCGYIGGGSDESGLGIAVDLVGNAYVTGVTGFFGSGFPVTVGPDVTHNGSDEAFIAKVNAAGTELVYCGYIGGNGKESGKGIAVDSAGNAYIIGSTSSNSILSKFPVTGGPDLEYNGGQDAFVAKVSDLPDLCLQDDRSRDILKFKLSTGEYEFIRCDFFLPFFPSEDRIGDLLGGGFGLPLTSLKGRGVVSGTPLDSGCIQHHLNDHNRVEATITVCPPERNGSGRTLLSPRFGRGFSIRDTNLFNNRCSCRVGPERDLPVP